MDRKPNQQMLRLRRPRLAAFPQMARSAHRPIGHRHVRLGAFTGQSATVFPFLKRAASSEDILQVVTSLSHAFDEAVELLGAAGGRSLYHVLMP